jgi:hypothetical protein
MTRIVACLLALTAGAAAQTGAIRGTVHDLSGTAVPNAVVSIQPAGSTSGSKAVAITNAKGEFRIKQTPGKWKLCATAAGFALNCETLDLVPTGSIDLKLTLAVGPIANPIMQSAEDNPLMLYAGQWTSTSHIYDTAMSKAQDISAKLTCTWTPDQQFLVCDQLITMAGSTHSQLTIYTRDHEKHRYVYSTFNMPGARPSFSELEVSGRQFIYNGSFEQEGKKTLFRTSNIFSSSGDHYDFVAEFSTDNGGHWTKTLEGRAERIAP